MIPSLVLLDYHIQVGGLEFLALELGDETFTLRPPTPTLRTDILLKLRFRITGHLVLLYHIYSFDFSPLFLFFSFKNIKR